MDSAILLILLGGVLGLALLLLPGLVAITKKHPFRWIILILGVTSPVFFGVTWLIALVWVFWPVDKTVIDPVLTSSDGKRNVGDAIAGVANNFKQGASKTPALESRLAEIERLFESKVISMEERDQLRQQAISKLA
jgi:hypothetical protein